MPIELVLEKLTDFEVKAIGRSIVGLENPDLSMFSPTQRDKIALKSVQFIEESLENPRNERALATAVYPIVNSFTGRSYNSESEGIRLASSFKNPEHKITVLVSLGKRDEARWVADGQIGRDFCELEKLVSLREQAEGRDLSEAEFRELSYRFLQEGVRFNRLSQYTKAHEVRGIEPILEKNEDTIDLVLRNLQTDLYDVVQSSKEEFDQQYKPTLQSFDALFKQLVTTKKEYIALATKYAEKGDALVASILNMDVRKFRLGKSEPELETLAETFIEKGYFLQAKRIQDRLDIPFDFDACFDYLVSYAQKEGTPEKFSHDRIQQLPLGLIVALQDAPIGRRRVFAKRLFDIVAESHSSLIEDSDTDRKWPHLHLYDAGVALATNKPLRNKFIQMVKSLRESSDPYSSSKPRYASDKTHETPKLKNLGDLLMGNQRYKARAWSAYKRDGVFGIRRVIRAYAATLRSEVGTTDSSPTDIQRRLLDSRGIKIGYDPNNDEGSPGEIEYALQSALEFELGTGLIQSSIADRAFNELKQGTRSVDNNFALGFISQRHYSRWNHDSPVKLAHVFHDQSEGALVVPDIVYREAAAKFLLAGAEDSLRGNRCSVGGAYKAGLMYEKLGNPGFIAFVNNNFL